MGYYFVEWRQDSPSSALTMKALFKKANADWMEQLRQNTGHNLDQWVFVSADEILDLLDTDDEVLDLDDEDDDEAEVKGQSEQERWREHMGDAPMPEEVWFSAEEGIAWLEHVLATMVPQEERVPCWVQDILDWKQVLEENRTREWRLGVDI